MKNKITHYIEFGKTTKTECEEELKTDSKTNYTTNLIKVNCTKCLNKLKKYGIK
jgi:hypothetical protein